VLKRPLWLAPGRAFSFLGLSPKKNAMVAMIAMGRDVGAALERLVRRGTPARHDNARGPSRSIATIATIAFHRGDRARNNGREAGLAWMARVDFRLDDPTAVARLDAFIRAVARAREEGTAPDDPMWPRLLTDADLARLDWPSLAGVSAPPETWRRWLASWMPDLATYEQEWVTRDPDRDRVAPGWDLLSLLDALLKGEYTLLPCDRTPDGWSLPLDPWSWPYGGIAASVALVEVFGGYVLGWDEGSEPYETLSPGRFS
jgi:hypothetical protein